MSSNSALKWASDQQKDRAAKGLPPATGKELSEGIEFYERFDEINELQGLYKQLGREPLTPEQLKPMGFLEAMGERGVAGYVPFAGGVSEAFDLTGIYLAAERIADDAGTDEDQELLMDWYVDQKTKALRGTSWGGTVGEIMSQLPAFAGEFVLTGGAFTAGRKVGVKAARSMISKAVEKTAAKRATQLSTKRALRKTVGEVAGGVTGAAGQATVGGALSGRWASETIQNLMPDMGLTEDESGRLGILVEESDMSVGNAILRGWASQVREFGSERLGWMIGKKGVGRLLNKTSVDNQVKGWRAAIGKRWLQGKAGRTVDQLEKLKRSIGWHGIVGEMFEERAGELIDIPIDAMTLGEINYAFPGFEHLSAEAVAFAIPGAGLAILNERKLKGLEKRAGRGVIAKRAEVLDLRAKGQPTEAAPQQQVEEPDWVEDVGVAVEPTEDQVESGVPMGRATFTGPEGEVYGEVEYATEDADLVRAAVPDILAEQDNVPEGVTVEYTDVVQELEQVEEAEPAPVVEAEPLEPGEQMTMFAPATENVAEGVTVAEPAEVPVRARDIIESDLQEAASSANELTGVEHSARAVPRQEQSKPMRLLAVGLRSAGLRLVPIDVQSTEDGSSAQFSGFASSRDSRVIYAQNSGPNAFRNTVMGLVAHEATHALERENPELFNYLVSLAPAEVADGIRAYSATNIGSGVFGKEGAGPEILVSEGMAMAVQRAITRIGNIKGVTDQAERSMLERLADWFRGAATRLGLKGKFAREMQGVVEQMIAGKDIAEIELPRQARGLERARRRGLAPEEGAVAPAVEAAPQFAPKTSGLTIADVARGVEAEPGTVLAEDISSDDLVRALENGIQFAPSGSLADVPRIPASFFANKDVFVYFADRMRVGTYTGLNPEAGIEIPLQGGPGYPHTSGQEGKAGWAFTTKNMVTSFNKQKKGRSGIGIVALFTPENLMGNQTFLRAWIEETKYAISSGKLTRGDAFEELNLLRESALKGIKTKAPWVMKWKSEWTSLDQVDNAMLAATFGARRSIFGWAPKGKKGPNKGAKVGSDARVEMGFPNLTEMVRLMSEPSFEGLPIGTVVSAVDFGAAPLVATTAEELGIKPHLSYPVVVEGRGVGVLERTVDILDVYTRPESRGKREEDIRSATLNLPVVEGQRIADEMQRKEGEGAPRFAPAEVEETPEERRAKKKEQNERDEAAIRAGALPSTRGRQRAAARITARRVKEARKEGRAAGLERGQVLQERAEARRDARDETARERRERQELKRRLQQQRAGAEAGYRAGREVGLKHAREIAEDQINRLKNKQANVERIKKDVVKYFRSVFKGRNMESVGLSDISRLMGQVEKAKTEASLERALTDIIDVSVKLRWAEAKKSAARVARRVKKATPVPEEYRKPLAEGVEAVNELASRKPDRTLSFLENTDALLERIDTLQGTLAEARALKKDIILQRKMTEAEAIASVLREIAEGQDPMAGLSRQGGKDAAPKKGPMSVAWRWHQDITSLVQRMTGKLENDSDLYALMVTNFREAEDQYNARLREVLQLVEESAKTAGFNSLEDAMVKLSGSQGETLVEMLEFTLGGRLIQITPAEAMHLVLMDPMTLSLIDGGVPLELKRAQGGQQTISVTTEEIEAVRSQMDPKLVQFAEDMKDILENEIKPGMFNAVREITGAEPESVPEYWPRSRSRDSKNELAIEDFLNGTGSTGQLMTMYLENMGVTKARARDTSTPIYLKSALETFVEHIDTGLRIENLAEPIRLADNVMRNDFISGMIKRRHGIQTYRMMREYIASASGVREAFRGGVDRTLGVVQSNVAVSYLTLNPRTWLVQLTAIPRFLAHFSVGDISSGISWMVSNMGSLREIMSAESGYFWRRWSRSSAERFGPQKYGQLVPFDQEGFMSGVGNAMSNLWAGKFGDAYKSWSSAVEALKVLDGFDAMVAGVAYGAARSRLEREGVTGEALEGRAAALAADAMRDTQNSTSTLDLTMGSLAGRQSPLARMFLLFSSDPLKTTNIILQASRLMREGQKRRGAEMLSGVILSSMLATGLRVGYFWGLGAVMAGIGGDDDDKKAADRAAKTMENVQRGIIRELSGLSFFGPAVELAYSRIFEGGFGKADAMANPVSSLIGQTIASGDTLITAISDLSDAEQDQVVEKLLSAMLKAATETTSLVAGNPLRPWINDVRKLGEAAAIQDPVRHIRGLQRFYKEIPPKDLTEEQRQYFRLVNAYMNEIRKIDRMISERTKGYEAMLQRGQDDRAERAGQALQRLRDRRSELAAKALGKISPSGG